MKPEITSFSEMLESDHNVSKINTLHNSGQFAS